MQRRALVAAATAALLLLAVLRPQLSTADSVVFRHRSIDPTLTDRIIVKWRDTGVAAVQIELAEQRAARLREATGINLTAARNLYQRTDVMQLDHTPSRTAMQAMIARLRADPSVEYAEPDGWRFIEAFPATLPNDPHFVASTDPSNANNTDIANYGSWDGQWYLLNSSPTTPAAISAQTAWQSTIGSANVIVAVIDTGIIENHPDFVGKLQPGYDFVSCDQGNSTTTSYACSATGSAATYDFSNDGGGWDADPSDPGDWIDSTDVTLTLFKDASCTSVVPSSWHGTKVAGVIGAVTDNGVGIAGIAPLTLLLPVRAIGKCSGRVSDIATAIRWAAGLGVTIASGATGMASPKANIINLSLAANTPCSATEQSAISDAIAAGVLVVAAAGNEGGPVDAPANCTGVLSVAGIRHTGTKVGYSSLSSSDAAVSIAAPAGNCVNIGTTEPCVYSIETTSDAGSTTPSSTPGFYTYALLNPGYLNSGGNSNNGKVVGTSFAAPMVSGVAALMLALRPNLTPSQLIARLQSSAAAFPTTSSTNTASSTCPLPVPTCTLAATTMDTNGFYTDTSQQCECICTTATCGAGMLNAASAVLAAQGAFVQITPSSTSGVAGQHIRLDGSGSTAAAGHTIATYQWTTDPATSDAFTDPTAAITTFVVPTFRSIDVTLTITDDAGTTTSATTRIQSAIGAASGGGGLEPGLLWLLSVIAAWRLYRRATVAMLCGWPERRYR